MKTLGIKGYFIYYSLSGFEDDAKKYLNENRIMYADKKAGLSYDNPAFVCSTWAIAINVIS